MNTDKVNDLRKSNFEVEVKKDSFGEILLSVTHGNNHTVAVNFLDKSEVEAAIKALQGYLKSQ